MFLCLLHFLYLCVLLLLLYSLLLIYLLYLTLLLLFLVLHCQLYLYLHILHSLFRLLVLHILYLHVLGSLLFRYSLYLSNCLFQLHSFGSFIGTSNREDLLVDRTGSRRFLCVSLKHAIDCTTSVEHKQLYAQLKTELLSGERSWFNKEEEQTIQQHNALFYKHVPEEEVFRLCFRFATEEDNPQEVLSLSATQLFERMKAAHPSIMREMTAYSLSRILPQLGERVHTTKGNVYRVVEC